MRLALAGAALVGWTIVYAYATEDDTPNPWLGAVVAVGCLCFWVGLGMAVAS